MVWKVVTRVAHYCIIVIAGYVVIAAGLLVLQEHMVGDNPRRNSSSGLDRMATGLLESNMVRAEVELNETYDHICFIPIESEPVSSASDQVGRDLKTILTSEEPGAWLFGIYWYLVFVGKDTAFIEMLQVRKTDHNDYGCFRGVRSLLLLKKCDRAPYGRIGPCYVTISPKS